MSLFLMLSLQRAAWPLHEGSWLFLRAPGATAAPGTGKTIQVGIWKDVLADQGNKGGNSSTRGFWDSKIIRG